MEHKLPWDRRSPLTIGVIFNPVDPKNIKVLLVIVGCDYVGPNLLARSISGYR